MTKISHDIKNILQHRWTLRVLIFALLILALYIVTAILTSHHKSDLDKFKATMFSNPLNSDKYTASVASAKETNSTPLLIGDYSESRARSIVNPRPIELLFFRLDRDGSFMAQSDLTQNGLMLMSVSAWGTYQQHGSIVDFKIKDGAKGLFHSSGPVVILEHTKNSLLLTTSDGKLHRLSFESEGDEIDHRQFDFWYRSAVQN